MFGCGDVAALNSFYAPPDHADKRRFALAYHLERHLWLISVDNSIVRIRTSVSQFHLFANGLVWPLPARLLEPAMASQKGCAINNDIYDQYGERWYAARDDPVALLRAEFEALFFGLFISAPRR